MEPDNQWGHYFHGRALYRLDRDEEAVAAYSRAIDIRDDYFFSRYWRGVAYAYLDQPELARPDFEKAVELRPLAAGANSNLGEAYYDLELPEQAARSFRIAALLDPNLGRPEARLSELVEPDQEVTLPSLAFAPPAPGRAVRYLQIVMPRETRSEMELAIGALANWFAAPQKATPEQSMFVIRTARDITDDGIALELKLEESRNFDGDLPDDYVAFRGIVITDIKPGGESGPHIRIDYRDADLTSLWPLKAGNEMIGTGRYLLQCDHGPRMMLVMMGCRTGMSNIQIGSFEYSFMVHKAERIHVPLGTFDTHVLRYREKAELKILARTDRREIETNWWFSPDADFWVKRTSQMDDKILTVVATDVLDG